MLEYGQFLLRNRRLIFWSGVIPFVLVAAGLSFTEVSYTSTATFMPQQTDAAASLGGLAAQFGVGLPGAADDQSPAFYADLLVTREVLDTVLTDHYPSSDGTATLIDILDIHGETPGLQLEKARKRMLKLVQVDIRTRTGVVALQVKMPRPELAQQVAQRLLDAVNHFNLEQRQTHAGAERAFNEQRLAELGIELRAAEDRLQGFLSKNRDFHSSPELSFQQDRLARDVALRQTVYQTVAQAYEQARLNQVRDTPVITVIERPSLPARRDGRGRLKYGLLFALLGGAIGLTVAMVREYAAGRHAAGDPEFERLMVLVGEAGAGWRSRWARIRGRHRPST